MRRYLIGLSFYIALSLFFLAFRFQRPVIFLRTFISYLFSPVPESIGYLINQSKEFSQTLHSLLLAYQQNIQLQKRLNNLLIREQRVKEILYENRRIRQLISIPPPVSYEFLVARIIGKEPFFYPQTILIDKGSTAGVAKDTPILAMSEQGTGLLGRVIEVFPGSSQVLLINDPRSELSALVQRSREDGVIRGKGRRELEMVYLNPQSDVAPGDFIITSGFGGIFPKGLNIGEVVEVSSGEHELQKKALVKPVVSSKREEEVLIMINKSSDANLQEVQKR